MAHLSGFANDIFISYAHLDNESQGSNERGWVDSFSEALEIRVAQLLGERPRIWRDASLTGNDIFLEQSRDAISRSAVMLCIVSPSYVKSEWCLRELKEFLSSRVQRDSEGAPGAGQRIFKVVVAPVPYSQQPHELELFSGVEFFSMDSATGSVHQLRQASGKDIDLAFWDRLNRVAHEVAERLSHLYNLQKSNLEPAHSPEVPARVESLLVSENNDQQRKLRVFLCHSSDDKPQVRVLYKFLISIGADPWLDEEKLLPGQPWELEIRKAVRASDAIVVCISHSSIARAGYVHRELRQALDVADEQPDDAVFLIPARLEDCKIPERLQARHWVNLFEERGNELLARALQARATQLSVEKWVNGPRASG